ncbi:hypothetical protein ABIC03_007850 [Bradyrhizobium sp. RT6a]
MRGAASMKFSSENPIIFSVKDTSPRSRSRAQLLRSFKRKIVVWSADASRSSGSAKARGGGKRVLPGTNNAFVEFFSVQKTYDGETLIGHRARGA